MQEPSWYGVLNSTYSRLRPQLQVALTLEDEGQSSPPTTLPSQVQEMHQMHENGMAHVCVLLHNVQVHVDGIYSSLCPISLSFSLSLSHPPFLTQFPVSLWLWTLPVATTIFSLPLTQPSNLTSMSSSSCTRSPSLLAMPSSCQM